MYSLHFSAYYTILHDTVYYTISYILHIICYTMLTGIIKQE